MPDRVRHDASATFYESINFDAVTAIWRGDTRLAAGTADDPFSGLQVVLQANDRPWSYYYGSVRVLKGDR